jgi:hypothetical protein
MQTKGMVIYRKINADKIHCYLIRKGLYMNNQKLLKLLKKKVVQFENNKGKNVDSFNLGMIHALNIVIALIEKE